MVWTKVWVELTQTCIASDTQFFWSFCDDSAQFMKACMTSVWAELCCCCSSTWHPGSERAGGTDQKHRSGMGSLATAGHQHSSGTAVKAFRWAKQQSVIRFLYVWCLLFSYTLDKRDLSNNSVTVIALDAKEHFKLRFFYVTRVIKAFRCYCRVVCNHPALSCSVWCRSYICTIHTPAGLF